MEINEINFPDANFRQYILDDGFDIGASVFLNCKQLPKFTLAAKVKDIGKNAFKGCAALKTITVKTTKLTVKNVKAGAFNGIFAKAVFKCPKKKKSAYVSVFRKAGAPKTCVFK